MSGRGKRAVARLEHALDAARLRRRIDRPAEHLRVVAYLGHGSAGRALVRGRVLDNREPSPVTAGESAWAAAGRTVSGFLTVELPGVPLHVEVGGVRVATTTDGEGYFDVEVGSAAEPVALVAPWTTARVTLAEPHRGVHPGDPGATAEALVRVPAAGAAYGVISDVDDTVLQTGVQRTWSMLLQTFTGSALTRTPFAGAAELYRHLEGSAGNPFFYVSSSPWNLHEFLLGFLEHRGFPAGPLLLRDLVGDGRSGTHQHKRQRIEEILALHPELPFVLVGDSGEHDPEIYADVVRRHPGRVLAVYIREVRLDPGDGRVEAVTDAWDHEVPFVLAADSAAVARHAAELGLLAPDEVAEVEQAVRAET
ncbi:App1 family protein [Nocardioides ferulae]|uniref:App1 family protein n=1 Tax=Nocardioides ferulae TaxID=2340821 RepID=UPI000EAD6ABF|nr:phosphatase domain-containing protein [Nocardioides ferulae]